MSSAATLRSQIEASLASRFAGALTPRPRTIREVAATGIAEIDALLSGGLPVGAISELVGPECSGRMSAALSFVAERGSEGRVSAWVDVSDGFDPESAAANGVGFSQLLWVRCSEYGAQNRTTPAIGAALPRAVSLNTRLQPKLEPGTVEHVQYGCAGQHPRNEIRGMDAAVQDLLHEQPNRPGNRSATPGAENRKLESRTFGPVTRNEQVSTDRQPKRSVITGTQTGRHNIEQRELSSETYSPRCAEAVHKPRPEKQSSKVIDSPAGAFNHPPRFQRAPCFKPAIGRTPWTRLDQALRATDLLLQAGGFSTIVLDLGSIGAEHALRIPLATWFRFRQAADHSRTSLLVLAQTSCAKSSAALVLRFEEMSVVGSTVVECTRFAAESSRQRFAPTAPAFISTAPNAFDMGTTRKPPQATWQSAMYSPVRSQGRNQSLNCERNPKGRE